MLWLAVVDAQRDSWTPEDLARRDLLTRLYDEQAVALVRLARIFTDDRAGAEDIVQEAFIRLFHATHRIESPDRAVSYLRSIVLNLVRDENRRGLMSLRHQDAMIDSRTPIQPDEQIATSESQAEVMDALSRLSRRQRECLVLRFYVEMSESDIASTLGISPNSVKTHCRRGLESLERLLEPAS